MVVFTSSFRLDTGDVRNVCRRNVAGDAKRSWLDGVGRAAGIGDQNFGDRTPLKVWSGMTLSDVQRANASGNVAVGASTGQTVEGLLHLLWR